MPPGPVSMQSQVAADVAAVRPTRACAAHARFVWRREHGEQGCTGEPTKSCSPQAILRCQNPALTCNRLGLMLPVAADPAEACGACIAANLNAGGTEAPSPDQAPPCSLAHECLQFVLYGKGIRATVVASFRFAISLRV